MSALQTFLRMANLFPPGGMGGDDMSTQLPVGAQQPQLINRTAPGISVPGTYDDGGYDAGPSSFGRDRTAELIEAFQDSVLNPPERTRMTYPKSTLNGLTSALKIAATPTDYEKNRVFVDGHPYQQVKAFKDPETGQIRYINKYKQPGFMEQVMKAMPDAVSPAVDILNQPREDAVADWEMKNKGMQAAINAESALALAQQRRAQADYTGQRGDIERDKLAVQRMTAEERVRASQLNTLTDEEKIQMLQEGKVSIQELQNAAALQRVMMQQAGATARNNATIAGANQRNAATIAGANQRNTATIAGANQRNDARIAAGQSGSGTISETQQRVAMQRKAAQIINRNPELAEYIIYDDANFPTISPDTPDEVYGILYEGLYQNPSKDIRLPAPGVSGTNVAPQTTTPPVAPVAAKPPAALPPKPQGVITPPPTQPGVKPIIQYSKSQDAYRISYDGGKTWRAYNPNGKK